MPSFLEELRRRKVVKVAIGYAIVGWLLVEVAATVLPIFEAPLWVAQVFTFFVILGFPLALILSWAFDITPEGVKATPAAGEGPPRPAGATGQKLNVAILAVMASALVFLVAEQFLLRRQITSIAAPSTAGSTSRLQRLSINVGPTEPIGNTGLSVHLTVSPDGGRIVYSAQVQGQAQLYQRALDDFAPARIPGTEGGYHPFFSPDGESVVFFSDTTDQKLKIVSLSGGAPVALEDAIFSPGGSWRSGNDIVVSSADTGGSRVLKRIPADGRSADVLIPASETLWPVFPEALPGGEAVLFTSRPANEPASAGGIAVLSLATGEYRTLIENGHTPRYAPTGHIVFVRDNALWAVAFDPEQLTALGPAVVVLDGVEEDAQLGGAPYGFSDDGLLVYVAGGSIDVVNNLVRVDRSGSEILVAVEGQVLQHPSLSPDGARVAYTVLEGGETEIWTYDLSRQTASQFTFDPAYDYAPLWSPDGEYIYFYSQRDGGGLYRKRSNGAGQAQLLLANGNDVIPESFTPDGSELIFESGEPPALYAMSASGDTAPRALLPTTRFRIRQASLSPDGRWLAYVNDENGRDEIYVVPYPDVDGGRWRISSGGGTEPRWRADGRELYYFATLGGPFTVVPVDTGVSFAFGAPVGLFTASYTTSELRNYTVAADGQSFLMTRPVATADTEAGVTLLRVVNHWFEELERLVPNEI